MKVGAACPRWFAWLAAFFIFTPIDLQGSQRRGDKRIIAYNKITSRRVWIIRRMPARQEAKRNIVSFNPCSCSPFYAVLVIGEAPSRGPVSMGGAPSRDPVSIGGAPSQGPQVMIKQRLSTVVAAPCAGLAPSEHTNITLTYTHCRACPFVTVRNQRTINEHQFLTQPTQVGTLVRASAPPSTPTVCGRWRTLINITY